MTARTSYATRLARYADRLEDARQRLDDIGPASPVYDRTLEERRLLLAVIDQAYVAASVLRSEDPVVRRLRRAERRARARQGAGA